MAYKADLNRIIGRGFFLLYKRAREGDLTNMTEISAPYEEPETPEIVIEPIIFK